VGSVAGMEVNGCKIGSGADLTDANLTDVIGYGIP
jgi:hypothetical protein